MTQNKWTNHSTEPDKPSGSGLASTDEGEGPIANLSHDAGGAVSEAKAFAGEKAEQLQDAAAGHFRVFADAVRTAGDELAEKEPGQVSDLVRRAAEGLEHFSDALGRKSSGEMIASVRDFGRQNPIGFLAGSMLAGFALARFASSSSPDDGAARSEPTDRVSGAKPFGLSGENPTMGQAPRYGARQTAATGSASGPGVAALDADRARPTDDPSFDMNRRTGT